MSLVKRPKIYPPLAIGMFKRGEGPQVVKKGDVGVIVVFKSASRSMVGGPKDKLLYSGRDELPKELYVFVRDPIERLQSAYQFFADRKRLEVDTWEEFVDGVLAGDENPHWRPVSDMVEATGRSDVKPMLFEELGEKYPLGKLGHKNKSTKREVNKNYRKKDIEAFYAKDYELREEARRANQR